MTSTLRPVRSAQGRWVGCGLVGNVTRRAGSTNGPRRRRRGRLRCRPPERLLGELIDGLLARFGGRRLTLTLHGHAVSGVLDGLPRLRRRGDHRALAVLTDVDWEGRQLEEVVVRAAPGTARSRAHLDAHRRARRARGPCSTRRGADGAAAIDLDWRSTSTPSASCAPSTGMPLRITGEPSVTRRPAAGRGRGGSATATSACAFLAGFASCATWSCRRCPKERPWSTPIASARRSRSGAPRSGPVRPRPRSVRDRDDERRDGAAVVRTSGASSRRRPRCPDRHRCTSPRRRSVRPSLRGGAPGS